MSKQVGDLVQIKADEVIGTPITFGIISQVKANSYYVQISDDTGVEVTKTEPHEMVLGYETDDKFVSY